MAKSLCSAGVLGLVVGLTVQSAARADLPPPPGQTRVNYTVRVTSSTRGVELVAYPTYVSAGGSLARVTPDQDLRFFQGYTPGIYSLPAEDAASLVGKDSAQIDKILAAKAHVCVKKVPRVFTVPSATKVTSMIDVFQIEATTGGCHASLAKTIYAGANGEHGEGTVDASGHRLPPAPFGKDLPLVEDLGFPLGTSGAASAAGAPPQAPESAPSQAPESAPPSAREEVSPPRAGCAGCALPAGSQTGADALALLALGLSASRRARRRR
jgi:hypothetical protein